jgi:hypothetical protein
VILGAAALVVSALLVVIPVTGAGKAAPIAVGAGITAVSLLALALGTGVTPPLLLAALLIVGDFAAVLVLGDAHWGIAPVAAGGLYLVVELAMRSLELRGRLPGWRTFTAGDAVAVAAVTAGIVAMAWVAAFVGTADALPRGIFAQAVGVAAVAAVIGILWVLVDRE